MLTGNVLLIGGSGFLGRATIRRAKREHWPCDFTIYSRDETKQWEVKNRWPDVRCVLGDVARDIDRLAAVMQGHETVIHMGAVKYIPEAEWNVEETVVVNIDGSRNVIAAAKIAGVQNVIGISTDKACAPLNLYGATKMVMERLFTEANRVGKRATKFATVRYGNVLGSTGSVIPLFARQIEEFGECRITDARMTRFWLSVDEAIDLILLALGEMQERPGVTLVGLNPAMTITDLARAVWQIERDMFDPAVGKLVYTGMRPGEKLHESLFNEQEAPRAYSLKDGAGELRGYGLVPATDKPVMEPGIPTEGYSSNNPIRWLKPSDVTSLILDAREV